MQAHQIISAYTEPFAADSIPESIQCHLLHTKYIEGNDPVATAPLTAMLLERWDTDLHFTMYTSPAEVRAVKHNPTHYELTFGFAAYDLDFAAHAARPSPDDFANLVRSLHVCDHTPNIVYSTRGGARIIYLIEPLYDSTVFEPHYQRFMEIIAKPLAQPGTVDANTCPYEVDLAAKDWTRLFRAPYVERDGEPTQSEVRLFHADLMDLTKYQPKPKKKYSPPTGDQNFNVNDPFVMAQLLGMARGNRNPTLFKLACHVQRHYAPQAQEQWWDLIYNRVVDEDFDDSEFWHTIKSAANSVGRDKQ